MRLIRQVFAGLASLVLATTAVATAVAAPGDELEALINAYWNYELETNPFGATFAGDHRFNDRVPDVTPQAFEAQAEQRAAFLEQLNAIDADGLDATQQINAELLRFILKHDVARAEFDAWRVPILADGGFHMSFVYVVSATPFRTEADYESYLTRLRALPGFLDQNIENMRIGLADGFTQPQEIIPFIIPSFESQIKDNAAAHPFYRPFNSMPDAISQRRQRALRREAQAILNDDVIPAYQRALTFMNDEYIPGARSTIGASEMPDGDDYYAGLVRFYTTLDDADADAIHQLGLKEVARIRREMDEVVKETGFTGEFSEFLEFLRTDEVFYAKTPEELLQRAAWISKDIDGRLPAYFGKLPRQPYSVAPVPAETRTQLHNRALFRRAARFRSRRAVLGQYL